jgi:hypothetical protein
MKGIELTQESDKPIWLPLTSIVSASPYMGFDGRETGTRIDLNGSSIRVMEDYVTVIEELQKL